MSYVEKVVRLSLGSAGECHDGFSLISAMEVGRVAVKLPYVYLVCWPEFKKLFKVKSDVIWFAF